LQTRRTQWPGEQTGEPPRSPLAHFHRLESWIEPDRFNNCTQSGCHVSLPHSQNKAVRAFLNMHATSLQCCVCHMQSDQQPLRTTWYSLTQGRRSAAPAVLRTFAWLTSEAGRRVLAAPTPADQKKLAGLLRTAALEADGDPILRQLADDIAAVGNRSPAFQQYVADARASLPRHFRGEYGAKVGLLDPATGKPILGFPGTAAAVQAYLRAAPTAGANQKAAMLADVHPFRRPQPPHCSDCHTPTGGLLDFAAVGYPPARIDMLTQPMIFQMIQHIAAGQPFYLPGILPSANPEPSAPATQPQAP